MKLRTKLTAICAVLLILTTTVLTGAMLWQVREQAYQSLTERTIEQLRDLDYSFGENRSKAQAADTEDSKKAMLRYLFESQGTAGGVLVMNGELLSAPTPFNPREYLDVKMLEGIRTARCVVGGRHYLITGRATEIEPDEYQLYIAASADFIEDNMMALFSRFAVFSFLVCVIGLVFLRWVIRKALEPLSTMQDTTNRIASGNYAERVAMSSKDEIGLLAENFNQMAQSVEGHIQSLKTQNERQRLFIGAVTHELKTPLTSLLLNVNTLRTVYLPEEKQEELLEAMDGQLSFLEQMVHKLLKLLSMKKTSKIRDTSVSELLTKVETLAQPIMQKFGTELEIHAEDVMFSIDIDLMCSAIINLIENSAKASKPGQHITLAVQKNSIKVSDYGCGIAAEDIDKITDAFYMVDPSRSKANGGYGLGLALVKEIADVHDARLDIQSRPGQGTDIALVFPEGSNITVKSQ